MLNKQGDLNYLEIWNIDYTSAKKRTKYSQCRNIDKEKNIESQITDLLRKTFYFRLIPLVGQEKRLGKAGLESRLIGTVNHCKLCGPAKDWLGKYSTLSRIKDGKFWLS